MMVATGVAIVCIRGESAKAANRIQRLHQQKVTLRQELWSKELELAKLRGPEAIRQRAAEMELEVVPPTKSDEEKAKTKSGRPTRSAAND